MIVNVDEYVPEENDICLMCSSSIEDANYYVMKYIEGKWRSERSLQKSMITTFLQVHQKISTFGHYDEGYYR